MANLHSLDLEAGSSQSASITDAAQTGLDIAGNHTIEAWIKPESFPTAGNTMMIACKGVGNDENYGFYIFNNSGTQQIALQHTKSAVYSYYRLDASLSLGVWSHVAASWNGTDFELYLDGSSLGSGQDAGSDGAPDANAEDFVVGNRSGASFYYDGLIDEVRVWDDVRSTGEIAGNYKKELVGTEAGLVGYWKLNNSYADTTSNGNDLTASNGPVFSEDVPFSGKANDYMYFM